MKSVQHHYMDLLTFTKREAVSILLLAFVAALGLTFRQWGGETYDPVTGVFNLLAVFIGMTFVILIHEFGHKIVAAWRGCTVDINMWSTGLIGSVIVQFLSAGFLPLFTPNTWEYDARPDRRLHRKNRYEQPNDEGIIAGGGLIGSSVAIALFHLLYSVFQNEVFFFITLGAVLHAIFSLIPFELLNFAQLRYKRKIEKMGLQDGSHLIWASMSKSGNLWMYLFAWTYIGFFTILTLLIPTAFFSVALVLIGSAGSTWAYYRWAT